jgi:hypothetical protein
VRKTYKIFVGKPEGKDQSRKQSTEMRVILKWILKKYDARIWTGFD